MKTFKSIASKNRFFLPSAQKPYGSFSSPYGRIQNGLLGVVNFLGPWGVDPLIPYLSMYSHAPSK